MPDVLPLSEREARREGRAIYEHESQAFDTDVGASTSAGKSSSPDGLVADPIKFFEGTSPGTNFNDTSVLRADTHGKTFVSGNARAIIGNYEHHEHHYHHHQQSLPAVSVETSDEQNQAFINTVLNAAARYRIPLPSKTTQKDPRSISRWVAEVIEAHVEASSLADGQTSDVFPSYASSKAVQATSALSSSAASYHSVETNNAPNLGHFLDDFNIRNLNNEDDTKDKQQVAMDAESISATSELDAGLIGFYASQGRLKIPSDVSSHQGAVSQDQRLQATRSTDDVRPTLLAEPTIEPTKISKPETFESPFTQAIATGNVTKKQRLVIGIDYGTTFTGVAFTLTESDIAQLDRIEVLQDWGPKASNNHKVPSVFSHSPVINGEENWGTDISQNAMTMINTKFELEVRDNSLDELELTLQLLERTGSLSFEHVKRSDAYPEYTWKTPTEIVTDYMTNIFECVWKSLGLGNPVNTTNTIDIVATVPVGWSYQATESIFKAFRQAGFNERTFPTLNDMILVTEPEAASHFTARDFQEGGTRFLRLNDCFILCDAGGGTVDVIAYQVKALEPHLELVQISMSSSDKCGASYVNAGFKRWLRAVIGFENFAKLEAGTIEQRINTYTTESGHMRQLIKAFEARKKVFSNKSLPVHLELPGPLDRLTIGGRVRDGELTISFEEMKGLFDPCVNRVIDLIEGQRQQVAMKNARRVKNVFLVGGFGESPYLQEELVESLRRRRIDVRRPETKKSLTAVVQGAVIYGVEKTRHKALRHMIPCNRSYGIVVCEGVSAQNFDSQNYIGRSLADMRVPQEQFAWLVRRGDLVLSDEDKKVDRWFAWTFHGNAERKFDLPVYTHTEQDEDPPELWQTGQHEVTRVGMVACDFSKFPVNEFELHPDQHMRSGCRIAYLRCKMQLSLTWLQVEVLVNEVRIGYTSISVATARSRRSAASSDDEYF